MQKWHIFYASLMYYFNDIFLAALLLPLFVMRWLKHLYKWSESSLEFSLYLVYTYMCSCCCIYRAYAKNPTSNITDSAYAPKFKYGDNHGNRRWWVWFANLQQWKRREKAFRSEEGEWKYINGLYEIMLTMSFHDIQIWFLTLFMLCHSLFFCIHVYLLFVM